MRTDAAQQQEDRMTPLLSRLCSMAVQSRRNIYEAFEWPETLPDDTYWMSPELMTIHGTSLADELDEATRIRLSRFELLHFFSLNVHGIRDLMIEVIKRIHVGQYESISGFLHHFVGEENEHMWYFQQFCARYGSRLYPDRKMSIGQGERPEIEDLLVFARIQIFEEIVDFFNARMGSDPRLHPFIQTINRAHHEDESRHIAFGRELVFQLHRKLRSELPSSELQRIEEYLRRYIRASIESLYNPAVYRDAGLPLSGYDARTLLLKDPVRHQFHEKLMARTVSSYVKHGVFQSQEI